MYIYIFEDGTIEKTSKIEKEDLQASDDGYMSIIDISNPLDPKDYINGEWESLEYVPRDEVKDDHNS